MIFRKIALMVTVNETNEFACIILQKPANLEVKLIRTIIALHSHKNGLDLRLSKYYFFF